MKFYVSSTTEDLGEWRSNVAKVIRDAGHEAIYMDDYGPDVVPPLEKCLKDVAASDVYVGIFAWRYGHLATGKDASITELEYRKARMDKKPTLIFVLHDDAPVLSARWVDKGNAGERMERLRQELMEQKTYTACFFKSREDLLQKVEKYIKEIIIKTPPRVSIGRLPSTQDEIFGREKELQLLDDAWEKARPHVLCLIGFGGTGKSALVWQWLMKMADDNYRGARVVFGWSFFSREQDQREVSADLFMTKAFEWFGEPTVPADPVEKGSKLAEVVTRHRTLLILDGLEAVQQSSGLNLSLLAMLKELAGQNPGLCIVTSRSHILELPRSLGGAVQQIDLAQLSAQAGAAWLRRLGVKGPQSELETAAREYQGHALSLTLLGTYLVEKCAGRISDRLPGGAIESPEEEDAFSRLIIPYEESLGEGPELDILRVLGLFNRPAPRAALDAVRAQPPIAGLTDHLCGLDDKRWNGAVAKLRKLKLVMDPPREEAGEVEAGEADTLDTHALVRHHFARQSQDRRLTAWKEANNRLFEHYRGQTTDLPETFADVEPLLQAVTHGCRAGRHQDTFNDPWWSRIRQTEEKQFIVLELGAYSADLVALANFFDHCWDRPVAALDDLSKARAWTEAAFDLRGLGRLSDAFPPMRAGLDAHRAQQNWWAACDAAGNLSELLTLWGDLTGARAAAEESIDLSKKAGDLAKTPREKENAQRTLSTNIATLADVLHQMGDFEEAEKQFKNAEKEFRDAERDYNTSSPSIPYLHALRGYHYCDLLLSMGKYEEVRERAMAGVKTDTAAKRPYGVGLAHMVHARMLIAQTQQAGNNDFTEARTLLNTALDELRNAGHHELISRSLIALAELYQAMGLFEDAIKQLTDTIDNRTRGQMRLLEIDALLQLTDIYLATGKQDLARTKLDRARKMIRDFGYGRRRAQLESLSSRLAR